VTRRENSTATAGTGIFAIQSAGDFLGKLEGDVALLMEDVADSGLAMNGILAAYHIHEWLWAGWLKPKAPVPVRGTMIRNKEDLRSWLDKDCPHFKVIQDLANGSKHCRPVAYGASEVSGYGRGPYGVGPFGTPYLLIDLGTDHPPAARWLVAHSLLTAVAEFWRGLFNEIGVTQAGLDRASAPDAHSSG